MTQIHIIINKPDQYFKMGDITCPPIKIHAAACWKDRRTSLSYFKIELAPPAIPPLTETFVPIDFLKGGAAQIAFGVKTVAEARHIASACATRFDDQCCVNVYIGSQRVWRCGRGRSGHSKIAELSDCGHGTHMFEALKSSGADVIVFTPLLSSAAGMFFFTTEELSAYVNSRFIVTGSKVIIAVSTPGMEKLASAMQNYGSKIVKKQIEKVFLDWVALDPQHRHYLKVSCFQASFNIPFTARRVLGHVSTAPRIPVSITIPITKKRTTIESEPPTVIAAQVRPTGAITGWRECTTQDEIKFHIKNANVPIHVCIVNCGPPPAKILANGVCLAVPWNMVKISDDAWGYGDSMQDISNCGRMDSDNAYLFRDVKCVVSNIFEIGAAYLTAKIAVYRHLRTSASRLRARIEADDMLRAKSALIRHDAWKPVMLENRTFGTPKDPATKIIIATTDRMIKRLRALSCATSSGVLELDRHASFQPVKVATKRKYDHHAN